MLPVLRPALHVLRMGGLHILDLAELSFFVHLLDEEELAAVDDGLGHHVLEAGFLDQLADLAAFFDRGGHRNSAHHVFAGLERGDGHGSVIRDRAVDVDEIDLGVGQHLIVARVAPLDVELVADLVELRLGSLADRVNLSVCVGLVDGYELGSEAKSDDRYLHFLVAHFRKAPAGGPNGFRENNGSPAG